MSKEREQSISWVAQLVNEVLGEDELDWLIFCMIDCVLSIC